MSLRRLVPLGSDLSVQAATKGKAKGKEVRATEDLLSLGLTQIGQVAADIVVASILAADANVQSSNSD